MPWLTLLFLLLLILANGILAGTEAALIATRLGLILARAARGDRRARLLSEMLDDPSRPLATIQIAITLIAFLTGVVGALTLAAPLVGTLQALGVPAGSASTVAVLLVTVALTYVTLVLGELGPKRIGMQLAERWALLAAPGLAGLSWLARPAVWLLSQSTTGLLRLLGVPPGPPRITEEELRAAIDEGRDEGVLGAYEAHMLQSIMLFTKMDVSEVMVPRPDIVAIDARETVEAARQRSVAAGVRRLPVIDGDIDHVLGMVYADDLLLARDPQQPVREVMRPVLLVPESKPVVDLLAEFRERGEEIAIVLDEYGGTAGLVTLEDLIEEIVGEIDELLFQADLRRRLQARPREGIAGSTSLRELNAALGLDLPIDRYDTIGGFIQEQLGRLPRVGDAGEWRGWRFVVTALRGRRIERVRVEPPAA